MKKSSKSLIALLISVALVASGAPSQAANSSAGITAAKAKSTSVTVKGPTGQTLTASATKGLANDQAVTLTGKGYNMKLGIYVTYCVMPEKGKKPENCGPRELPGQNNSSIWLSSNPPLYAALFVTGFGKKGTFKVQMRARDKIGDFDCREVRCAFLTRADHTNPDNRKADVIIPVTFK